MSLFFKEIFQSLSKDWPVFIMMMTSQLACYWINASAPFWCVIMAVSEMQKGATGATNVRVKISQLG